MSFFEGHFLSISLSHFEWYAESLFFAVGLPWWNVVVMVKCFQHRLKIDFFHFSEMVPSVMLFNRKKFSALKIMQFSCWTFEQGKCGKISSFVSLAFSTQKSDRRKGVFSIHVEHSRRRPIEKVEIDRVQFENQGCAFFQWQIPN